MRKQWYVLYVIGIVATSVAGNMLPNMSLLRIGVSSIVSLIPMLLFEGKPLSKVALAAYPYLNALLAEHMVFVYLELFHPEISYTEETYYPAVIAYFVIANALYLLIPAAFNKLYEVEISNRHWVIALITILLMNVLTYFQGYLAMNNGMINIYTLLIPLAYLIFAYSILFIIKEISRHYSAASTEKVSAVQFSYYTAQHEQMLTAHKTISNLRHEMKNNLSAMRIELDKGNLDSIRQRLDSQLGLLENPQEEPGPAQSDNSDVNDIINLRAKDAAAQGIVVDAHLRLPAELPISTFDLSAVLGNALDNAIEAVSPLPLEQRSVHVQMMTTATQLEIIVSNPFPGEVIFRDGEPVSTKNSTITGLRHGYGFNVMRQVAEQHGGYLFATHQDEVFTLSVFMQIA